MIMVDKIINEYSNTFTLLNNYDSKSLTIDNSKLTINNECILDYNKSIKNIIMLKEYLIMKNEATQLFGVERGSFFENILNLLNQSFGGNFLYPSIEEKAANLIYLIIKDHPFVDGNKRVGAFMFASFLDENNYYKNKKNKINADLLFLISLSVAQSNSEDKSIIINNIISMLIDV